MNLLVNINKEILWVIYFIQFIQRLDMFKALAIGLALIAGSNSLGLRHEDAINVAQLSDVQKLADKFFREKIPNLAGAQLVSGDQNGNYFDFQYVSQSTPITLTQTIANRVDEANNKFKLQETTQSLSGPINGGRMTNVKKTYAIENFDKAVENLGWK